MFIHKLSLLCSVAVAAMILAGSHKVGGTSSIQHTLTYFQFYQGTADDTNDTATYSAQNCIAGHVAAGVRFYHLAICNNNNMLVDSFMPTNCCSSTYDFREKSQTRKSTSHFFQG